jgi:hypothetical protein
MSDPRISASDHSFQRGEPPATPAAPPEQRVLRADYALTLEDAVAFYRYDVKIKLQAGVPPWVLLIFGGVALIVGVLTRLMLQVERSFDLFDGLLAAGLVWILYRVFISHRLAMRRALRAVRRNPRFFQPNAVTISPEGLSWTDPSGWVTAPWHAVVSIVTHGEHAFFYKTDRKTTILPQRAFADARQFDEFVDTARRYHAAARRFTRTEGEA